MSVTSLSATEQIQKPLEEVWQVLSNPGDIKLFHPLIKDSYMLTDQKNGLGAKRYCALKPMGVMKEEIRGWHAMSRIETEVTGGKMLPPYEFMRGILELRSVNNVHTEVTFTLLYKLKFGLFGKIMNSLFIRPQFKSAPGKYVYGLKEYAEKL